MKRTHVALVALVALASRAAAFHRQTPPIVALTDSGDSMLPHVAAPGHRLVLALDLSGRQIFRQNREHNVLEEITAAGDNDNPTISLNGPVVAWDSNCDLLPSCTDRGRQIFMWIAGTTVQVTHDPTGTSVNPALSGKGYRLAFESRGDLAGTGNAGARQVFLHTADGTITQVSRGNGDSANASLDRRGLNLVFDSTSGLAGEDTGISQIWLLSRESPLGPPLPVTTGQAASTRPAISSDGRVVVFESRAALADDGHDTKLTQIFAFDTDARSLTQVTNDALGCSGASVDHTYDWRVAFTCHGEGFFHLLRANQRYRLPIDGGDTAQAVAELGRFFVVVSTTANLLGSGTTPGHQLYMLNLFKLPAQPVE